MDYIRKILADGFSAKAQEYYGASEIDADIPEDSIIYQQAKVSKAIGDIFTSVAKALGIQND